MLFFLFIYFLQRSFLLWGFFYTYSYLKSYCYIVSSFLVLLILKIFLFFYKVIEFKTCRSNEFQFSFEIRKCYLFNVIKEDQNKIFQNSKSEKYQYCFIRKHYYFSKTKYQTYVYKKIRINLD